MPLYLTGTAAWFTSFGIQSVLFQWLVTVVLHETPQRVGLAQFAVLLPTLLLILFGGVIADRHGGARVALIAQALAVVPIVALAVVVGTDRLAYPLLLAYGLAMGTVAAFVTPARDGLLTQVAGPRIQRMVVLVSLVQFGVQILGYGFAGLADRIGALAVIGGQGAIALIGAAAFGRLAVRLPATPPVHRTGTLAALREGFGTVLGSGAMRSVVIVNTGVGLFFMGAFQVGIPLFLREVHGATPAQLALVNAVHMLGIVCTTLGLLRLGDVRHRGRAMLLSVLVGAGWLAGIGLSTSLPMLLACNFAWGLCAGVLMSMSRTIMQEAAPPDRRGRVMAFFSFSFMGAGPAGALLAGALVDWVGVRLALLLPAAAIAALVLSVALTTRLWSLAPEPEPVEEGA